MNKFVLFNKFHKVKLQVQGSDFFLIIKNLTFDFFYLTIIYINFSLVIFLTQFLS